MKGKITLYCDIIDKNFSNTNCTSKCAESHFASYNSLSRFFIGSLCRYLFEGALGEKQTKGAFQIVIGMNLLLIHYPNFSLHLTFKNNRSHGCSD